MTSIAFIHSASILGGSEKSFLDLIDNIPISKQENCICILPEKGPLYDMLIQRINNEQIHIVKWPSLFKKSTRKNPLRSYIGALLSFPILLKSILKTLQLLKKHNITTIYSNGIKSHILSLIYKFASNYSLIWHMQDYFPNLRIIHFFIRILNVSPNSIIANSKSVLEEMKSHVKWNQEVEYRVVHNAVNLQQFSPPPLQRGNTDLTISMIGMLTPWKGQDLFIEAIYWLLKESPDLRFKCYIVGDEVYKTAGESGFKSHLEKLLIRYELQNTIEFTGLVTNITDLLQKTDIVVHCSKLPEPFGRVIIEAMSCECAVIAANAGGVKEIITHDSNGLLVKPNNPHLLKSALKTLLLDESQRHRLAAAGRQTVIQKFSSDHYSKLIVDVIEHIA